MGRDFLGCDWLLGLEVEGFWCCLLRGEIVGVGRFGGVVRWFVFLVLLCGFVKFCSLIFFLDICIGE